MRSTRTSTCSSRSHRLRCAPLALHRPPHPADLSPHPAPPSSAQVRGVLIGDTREGRPITAWEFTGDRNTARPPARYHLRAGIRRTDSDYSSALRRGRDGGQAGCVPAGLGPRQRGKTTLMLCQSRCFTHFFRLLPTDRGSWVFSVDGDDGLPLLDDRARRGLCRRGRRDHPADGHASLRRRSRPQRRRVKPAPAAAPPLLPLLLRHCSRCCSATAPRLCAFCLPRARPCRPCP